MGPKADASAIAAFLRRRLTRLDLDEVTAVEAAQWLDREGQLSDSASRPGLPPRNLLREGQIAQAVQRPPQPNGRWVIVRDAATS